MLQVQPDLTLLGLAYLLTTESDNGSDLLNDIHKDDKYSTY